MAYGVKRTLTTERKAVSEIMLTLLLTSMLTMAFNVNTVTAYKSGIPAGTHWFIFDRAKVILKNDGYTSYADFLDSVEPSSGLTYLEIMIKGSEEHDDLISAREHYMDPMDHKGLWFFGFQKSAGTLAKERFDTAVLQWRSGNYYDAMYNLGWAAHLVQDVTVPHHAWTTYQDWHSQYEDWVKDNGYLYAIDSGGTYSFPLFTDLQYYTPKHYSWMNLSTYDWVDYNAHESIKYFLSVNSYAGTLVTDAASPFIETIHSLPNNLETTWIITAYQANGISLHFEKIDMQHGLDYIRMYDKYDNLLDAYTGQYGDFWTPTYTTAPGALDTLKIKVTTDSSVQSWGYKIKEARYYDTGEDLHGATSVLLPRAQRTTAGFIKFFFDKVLNPIYIRPDGSIDPPIAPIQRDVDLYTLTGNIASDTHGIVIERNNVIIDGNGHTLQGAGNGDGFYLSGVNNVTIKRTCIQGFYRGIYLYSSSYIYHNNFVNNTIQAISPVSENIWDDGYPSGGNYWSDYTGVDADGDGIGDSPYVIEANNQDNHPLINRWPSHDIAVKSLSLSKTIVGSGYCILFNVTVANQGDFPENFNLIVYANNTVIATQIFTLSNRGFASVPFVWNTTGFAKGSYIISAYVTLVSGEIDAVDNILTNGVVKVATPGDMNADGAVNILDSSGISAHWFPGPPIGLSGYEANFDIDGDGNINMLDVAVVSAYWTGPPKGPLAS